MTGFSPSVIPSPSQAHGSVVRSPLEIFGNACGDLGERADAAPPLSGKVRTHFWYPSRATAPIDWALTIAAARGARQIYSRVPLAAGIQSRAACLFATSCSPNAFFKVLTITPGELWRSSGTIVLAAA